MFYSAQSVSTSSAPFSDLLRDCLYSTAACLSGCVVQCGRLCRPKLRSSEIAPVVRQRVLRRQRSGSHNSDHHEPMDIHTLLVRPDPSRSLRKSYRTVSQLGKGGFGSVYRVEYLPTGEERAIKMMPKPQDPTERERVLTEVQLLITLDHPSIEKFYELFEDAKVICLVTELCLGGNMGELNPQYDSTEEIRKLFHDVVAAVSYCHSQGVVHRDLKFENVLLTRPEPDQRRMAKVIDFGLSSLRPESGRGGDRWMDEAVGTVYFIAPEVIRTDGAWRSKYGPKCDMWSIGVMLYIVYTDQHPFAKSAMRASQILKKIRGQEMRLEPLQGAHVPKDVKDLTAKLLQKDPATRLSGREALRHAYFRGPLSPRLAARGATCEEIRSIFSRVCSFSRFSRFEKALMTIVAHDARSREIEDLRLAFECLDVDGAGWLSRDGIVRALTSKGLQLSKADLDATFEALDPDGDDKIMYTDWLAATIEPSLLTKERALKEMFDFFDIHGNGQVSRSDLIEVLGDEVARRGGKAENSLPEEFDCSPHKDRDVTWEEFQCLIKRIALSLQAREKEEELARSQSPMQSEASC
mmetsp:Transcript_75294/g.156853  ORF Transcript_75294/g.156853 Transcript_75294/m.156853 type:complete len:580 (+) Transcript_75294:131-1870(+)